MKCKEVEQAIFLYEELAADERSKVDEHVSTCTACALLLDDWRQAKLHISQVKKIPLLPDNSARLTHRIMNAIEMPPKATGLEFLWLWFAGQQVRYGFAILSVVIIVFFVAEQERYPSMVSVVPNNNSGRGDVVLNSGSFIKARQEEQKNENSMSFTALQTCAKQTDCNHALIENFKTKKPL